MLHIIFHASLQSGSEVEDFFRFSVYFYSSNPGPPGVGSL